MFLRAMSKWSNDLGALLEPQPVRNAPDASFIRYQIEKYGVNLVGDVAHVKRVVMICGDMVSSHHALPLHLTINQAKVKPLNQAIVPVMVLM